MINNKLITFLTLGILILAVLIIIIKTNENKTAEITNFEECANAGYPIMESYPPQCRTPDGRNFFEEIEEPTNRLDEYYQSIDYSCQTDSDCEIKNIANCCGYFLACTNKNAMTNPELVSQVCQEEELFGICGFPAIDECACVQNTCKPKYQGEFVS